MNSIGETMQDGTSTAEAVLVIFVAIVLVLGVIALVGLIWNVVSKRDDNAGYNPDSEEISPKALGGGLPSHPFDDT